MDGMSGQAPAGVDAAGDVDVGRGASTVIDLRNAVTVQGLSPSDADTIELDIVFQDNTQGRLAMSATDVQRLVALLLLMSRACGGNVPAQQTPEGVALIPAD